jgi:hypothetical protein
MKIKILVLPAYFIFGFIPSFISAQPVEFTSVTGAEGFAQHLNKEYAHVELLLGFGSKQQFSDIGSLLRNADKVITANNEKYGKNKWSILYGGDGANPDKPDVGFLAKHFSDAGVPVYAAQQRIVKEQWGGVPSWVKGVYYDGPIGQQSSDVKWGGTEVIANNRGGQSLIPIGNTGVYLGDTIRATLGSKLSVRAFGGGDIALAEVKYAQAKGVHIDYHQQEARFMKDGKTPVISGDKNSFGPLHDALATSAPQTFSPTGYPAVDCGKALTQSGL